MNVIEELMIKIGCDSKEAESGMQKFSKTGAAVFGAFQRIGMKAVDTVFSAVSSNMGGAIQRLDTLNNFTNIMTSIGFGADEAKATINGLADGIEKLPTTLDAVARQTQGIAAITKDMGEAKDITLALNNMLAAGGVAGADAAGAIAQWTQAMAKGKPDFVEWQRLVQSSPAQMDQLAKYILNSSDALANDLYSAVKDGSVSIAELNKGMVDLTQGGDDVAKTMKQLTGKEFHNWQEQAEKASAGIQMASLNIKAAIQRNIANVLDSINKRLGEGGIAKAMESIIPTINKVGEAIQHLISGDWSFDTFASKMLDSIGQASRKAVHEGANIVINLANGLAKSGPALLNKATLVVSNLLKTIANLAPSLIQAGINLVLQLALGLVEGIPNLLVSILDLVTSIVNGIGESEGNFVEVVMQIITTLLGVIIASAPQILSAIWNLIKAIGNAFITTDWLSLGLNALRGVLSGLESVAPSVIDLVSSLVQKVLEWFGFTGLAEKVGQAFETAKTTITTKLDEAKNKITGWIDTIKGLFPINLGNILKGWFNVPSMDVKGDGHGGFTSTASNSEHHFAKAMSRPYMFDRKTAFMAGEAGDEMLYGRSALMEDIREASGYGYMQGEFERIVAILEEWLPQMANLDMILDTGALVGELSADVDREMGRRQTGRSRGNAR